MVRYGSMNSFPFGLHASNKHGWHKWGNSQALAEAGLVDSARAEADQFYPRLLVEGWRPVGSSGTTPPDFPCTTRRPGAATTG